MDITRANLNILTTSFSTAFSNGLGLVPPMYQRVAMTIPSATKENSYAWLKDIPGMREWLGDRVVNQLAIDGYRLANRSFEMTVGVKRDDIEDDQYGVYAPMFRFMGENAARHPNELAFELLNKGFETPCYDGQYFFDTDHPVLDESGAEKSVSNFMGGTGQTWYLACTGRSVKPLIFQTRKPAVFTRLDKQEDENVFMRGEYLYGVNARYNVGFGLWQLMVASKQALTPENFEAARAALLGMTRDYGGKLALTADLLLVPPALEGAARRIVNAEIIGRDGVTETNIWKGASEVLACPWL
jgi:phage major head subunit gpT-like protein